jgi:hypothetical protein
MLLPDVARRVVDKLLDSQAPVRTPPKNGRRCPTCISRAAGGGCQGGAHEAALRGNIGRAWVLEIAIGTGEHARLVLQRLARVDLAADPSTSAQRRRDCSLRKRGLPNYTRPIAASLTRNARYRPCVSDGAGHARAT